MRTKSQTRAPVRTTQLKPRKIANIAVDQDPQGIVINESTNRIYVPCASSNAVMVINGNTNRAIKRIRTGSFPSRAAVNARTNQIFVTNSGDYTVSVINGFSHRVIRTIRVGQEPLDIVVNPKTNKAYVANQLGDTISVINGSSGQVKTIQHVDEPSGLALNPETNQIYVISAARRNGKGQLFVIDGNSDEVSASIPVGLGPDNIAVNTKTNRIYVANTQSRTVSVIQGDKAEVERELTLPSAPVTLKLDPSRHRLYVLCTNRYQGAVAVFNTKTNQQVSEITAAAEASDLAIHSAKHAIYLISPASEADQPNGQLKVMNTRNLSSSQTLDVGTEPVDVIVNHRTSRIYVLNFLDASVTVVRT